MRAILAVFRAILRAERAAFLRGAALAVCVAAMGAALLGLSGWFIVAAGAAGLAGSGATFDVFRPSAAVRFLALGRAAARYGERLLTHDATLRALTALRVRLLERLAARPFAMLERVRGAQALNRLTADVDALDGAPLRLILPVAAGAATQVAAGLVLAWLASPAVGLWVAGLHLAGGAAVLVVGARAGRTPARRAERALQALRARVVSLVRASDELAMAGRLGAQVAHALEAERRRRVDRASLDRIERRAGLALDALTLAAAAGALALGLDAVAAGALDPARAAIGPFVALALAETLAPLRRAVADYGRIADAARRVAPALEPPAPTSPLPAPAIVAGAPALRLRGVSFARAGAAAPTLARVDLDLAPGETVALTAPSGGGKSTLLALCAGVLPPSCGTVALFGRPLDDWPEPALRAAVALAPQRPALMRGTLREALRLAAPDAPDSALRAALEAAALWPAVAPRGGLDLALGDRGAGLSGGEGRRLALARVLLRRPAVLLLDEPTEGLDAATADRALAGLRAALPEAAILVAAHRPAEIAWADRALALR